MRQWAWREGFRKAAILALAGVLGGGARLLGQNPVSGAPHDAPALESAEPAALRLLIGPGDEIELTFYGIPDLNQRVRVDSSGEVSLALVGNVEVAGMTAEEAQLAIEAQYVNGGYLKNPHVTVFVKEYTTQKVTVAGEVAKPGVYSMTSNHRLQDVILAAGGVTEKAGNMVSITHAGAGEPQVVTLSDDPGKAAKTNVEILPGDTVVVSRAGIVYVIGEVNRAGGYVMEDSGSMTASQAVAKAAGPTPLASLSGARVIRRTADGLKTIELPLNRILQAKAPDLTLQADDIVYIPNSKTKSFLSRSTNSLFAVLTGLAIYR
jgi:polysaccharide export outer membrane protein